MQSLEEMVDALPNPQEKSYLEHHMTRGLHPAEAFFVRHTLLAREDPSPKKVTSYILKHSLADLPDSPSAKAFTEIIKERIPAGIGSIEKPGEMLRVANIASLIKASADFPRVQETEAWIEREKEYFFTESKVRDRRSAYPAVLVRNLVFLHYPIQDFGGICLQKSFPGKGRGFPIVFLDQEDIKPDANDLTHNLLHEMIHSAQRARLFDKEPRDWDLDERRYLLEAITEGLNIARFADKIFLDYPFRFAYDHVVLPLFRRLHEIGIAEEKMADYIEDLNDQDLGKTAELFRSRKHFTDAVKTISLAKER